MTTSLTWTIRVAIDGREVMRHELAIGASAIVGRDEQCDVVIPESSVSRRHCSLRGRPDGVEVKDLGSANGLWVGDRKFPMAVLTPGTTARIGLAILSAERVVPPPPKEPEKAGSDTSTAAERARAALASAEVYTSLAKDRLATLIEVGKLLALSGDPEDLLVTILDLLPQILPVQRAVIALQDERGELQAKLAWPRQEFEELSQIPSRQIIRRVMASGVARLIDDASRDDDFRAGTSIIISDIKAAICAPLIVHQTALGAVYADFPGRAALYTREDLDYFSAFASLAAVAIETANMQRALRERERLQRDIEIAAEIQRGLLPSAVPAEIGFEVASEYRPSHQVGGDFYDFLRVPEGRLAVTLGDVSGKSVGAALLMARLVSTLRAVIDEDPMPDAVLSRVNDLLVQTTERPVFATACQVLLCPAERKLWVASAGHLPARLLLPGESKVRALHPKGLPLGIQRGSRPVLLEQEFPPGGLLFLHTDGVHEARNARGEQFGIDRLDQLLLAERRAGCPRIAARVLESVQQWKRGANFKEDDIAIVVLRSPDPA